MPTRAGDDESVSRPAAEDLLATDPAFDRARDLARQAITATVYGGPAADGFLASALNEATGDRVLATTLLVLLTQVAGGLAGMVAELASPEPGAVDSRPVDLQADEMVSRAVAVVTELLDELQDPDFRAR